MTNSSLLSHFNHTVLSDKVLFFSSDRKTMLILIFLFPTVFPHKREFKGMCHRLNYWSKFLPSLDSFTCSGLACGLATCCVLDDGTLVMCKQRLRMRLHSQPCFVHSSGLPGEAHTRRPLLVSLGPSVSTRRTVLTRPTA